MLFPREAWDAIGDFDQELGRVLPRSRFLHPQRSDRIGHYLDAEAPFRYVAAHAESLVGAALLGSIALGVPVAWEPQFMVDSWKALMGKDPAYNSNMILDRACSS
jgi:hypothetical protein